MPNDGELIIESWLCGCPCIKERNKIASMAGTRFLGAVELLRARIVVIRLKSGGIRISEIAEQEPMSYQMHRTLEASEK
jgi:hypothetical protein